MRNPNKKTTTSRHKYLPLILVVDSSSATLIWKQGNDILEILIRKRFDYRINIKTIIVMIMMRKSR